MVLTSEPIRYVNALEKIISWAKEWIRHINPNVSEKDIETIFEDAKFFKKYSSKPPKNLSSQDILKDAETDIDAYTSKVIKRIKALNLDKEERVIHKVSDELPSGEELAQMVLSYRIYNTEGRARLRIPNALSVKLTNIDAKQIKNKNTKQFKKINNNNNNSKWI